ncbi:hypothetical protein, partial [Aliivibrio fischeri]
LIVVGWFFSLVLAYRLKTISDIEDLEAYVQVKTSENAFNMVSPLLKEKTDEEIIQQIELWFHKGSTAQTGSIVTLCENNRDALR